MDNHPGRFLRLLVAIVLGLASVSLSLAQTKVFPIQNGKLTTNLDANSFQIVNLDTSNLTLGAGTYQPLDADLTKLSGIGVTDWGKVLLTETSTSTLFSYLSFAPPQNSAHVSHNFLSAYNSSSGAWTLDQPDVSDLTGTLTIGQGGTGQTTANAALNALLPDQTGQAGNVLQSDGTNTTWQTLSGTGGTAHKIATLTTKAISNLTDPTAGQVLMYNAVAGWWEPNDVTSAAAGTVTKVSADSSVFPLFSISVTNATTTPLIHFSMSAAGGHSVLGNPGSLGSAPVYYLLNIAALSDAGTLGAWSVLTAPSSTPVGISDTQTLTNKTIDATTNTIKLNRSIQLMPVRVDGSNTTFVKDPTSASDMQVVFSGTASGASNWTEYRFIVPKDFDVTVDPTVVFKYTHWLSDSLAQRYVFSVGSVSDGGSNDPTPGTSIGVNDSPHVGGPGTVWTITATLTGWGSLLIPGQLAVVRVARDGSNIVDSSDIQSASAGMVIRYASN